MKGSRRWVLVSVALAALTVMAPAAGAAGPASPPCGRGWRIVDSPNPGGSSNIVSVVSFPGDRAWAVGFVAPPTAGFSTAALHHDASGWTEIPPANPDPQSNRLDAVDGLSDSDVWAVGSRGNDTLIEHWDGSSWSVVPSPSPPHAFSGLDGVSVLSFTDAWAVGYSQAFSGAVAGLILHWDGQRWTRVASPNPGRYTFLLEVDARSPDDAWAVGSYGSNNLILRWDGATWSQVPAPSPGLNYNTLEGVVALGPDDAWAVGNAADEGVTSRVPVTLHWDGSAWNQVPSPTLSGQLNAVAAAPDGQLWAVGYREVPPDSLIERWDGSAWHVIRSENVQGAVDSTLFGVALGDGPGSAWAVGSAAVTQSELQALVEHPCAASS